MGCADGIGNGSKKSRHEDGTKVGTRTGLVGTAKNIFVPALPDLVPSFCTKVGTDLSD